MNSKNLEPSIRKQLEQGRRQIRGSDDSEIVVVTIARSSQIC
jgi:hypothetical protein